MQSSNKYDIIIVGAGIAGINTAYRVQTKLPTHSYVILEARAVAGGTWDIFRYPGVRLDSDIHTYGFSWQPYYHDKTMLDGSSVLEYINSIAEAYGINNRMLFNHRVKKMNWNSHKDLWDLTVENQNQKLRFISQFVIFATGYFDHEQPLSPEVPGLSNYTGTVVHPQFWPEDLDYAGKNIAIIGSGATAISLVPKLAEKASTVTMIQRSPNYILSIPSPSDNSWTSRLLPAIVTHKLKRYGWLAVTLLGYYICRKFPSVAKGFLLRLVRKQLPEHVPLSPHFDPKYNVWDQRLLACPDGDFFQALHSGKAKVQTANIQAVTASCIHLDNGSVVKPDIIVTATGLRMQVGGGTQFALDGHDCDLCEKFMWKGMMLQDIPNSFFVLGYLTNASWTLGTDVTALSICRLIKHMQKKNILRAAPRMHGSPGEPRRLWNLNSTYIINAEDTLPRAGETPPWQPRSSYILDYVAAQYGPLGACMEFSGAV